MKLSQKAKKAFYLGTLCSIAYFAVYIARNALSAAAPKMTEAGYTEAYIGSVSSLFFVFYAVGQLINGIIGDKIKAKWMISGGLLFAAISNALFPYLGNYPTLAMLIYALSGFFLSMIYGPMTKVVSENTGAAAGAICRVAKDALEVQTGDGVLSLLEVQLEGKKRMEIDAFLRGYSVQEDTVLGE